jgi:hypothetical protein
VQAVVQNVVRSTLSLTFVIAAARVVFNVKGRMLREATWEMELKGDLTKQRRVEVGLGVLATHQGPGCQMPSVWLHHTPDRLYT